jgi:hypothetical protein
MNGGRARRAARRDTISGGPSDDDVAPAMSAIPTVAVHIVDGTIDVHGTVASRKHLQ